MRFYALVIFILIWTLCRLIKLFLDDCIWIDIPFEIENDCIFYPLAVLYIITKAMSIPIAIGCLLYIFFF